jgi:AraC family transcriptional regulator
LQKLLVQPTFKRDPLPPALLRKAQNGLPGASEARLIAFGEGWRVVDIVCTYGPGDRPFEEHFLATSISLVLAGSFLYRSSRGATLMARGCVMLGNCGSPFECSHPHGEGDRCLSFQFEPGLFERIAHDVGAKRATLDRQYLPPLRGLARLSAWASIVAELVAQGFEARFGSLLEEIALDLAGRVMSLACDTPEPVRSDEMRNAGRIVHVLRRIETSSDQVDSIADLAQEAGLSRYHFLRTFKRTMGITPHQWLMRTRLRKAAERLFTRRDPVTEIALDIGFGDLSNFIRCFRAEFGVSPSQYRTSRTSK